MVTKITLFEPHFDGAQIGPTAVDPAVTNGTSDSASEESRGESRSLPRPPIRAMVAVGTLIGAIAAGFVVRRQIQHRRGGTVDTEDEPTIEAAPVADRPAE